MKIWPDAHPTLNTCPTVEHEPLLRWIKVTTKTQACMYIELLPTHNMQAPTMHTNIWHMHICTQTNMYAEFSQVKKKTLPDLPILANTLLSYQFYFSVQHAPPEMMHSTRKMRFIVKGNKVKKYSTNRTIQFQKHIP